eukprot:scaffold462_cov195-Pinguiococcus_pyrenoidosus.AAC.12
MPSHPIVEQEEQAAAGRSAQCDHRPYALKQRMYIAHSPQILLQQKALFHRQRLHLRLVAVHAVEHQVCHTPSDCAAHERLHCPTNRVKDGLASFAGATASGEGPQRRCRTEEERRSERRRGWKTVLFLWIGES